MPPKSRSKRFTVIYHSADYDGKASGLIVREWIKWLGDRVKDKDITMIGWDYGDPDPAVGECDELFMVDISVRSLMNHPKLVWIDHHKTAIDEYGPKPGIQMDGVAACRLAWQYMSVPHLRGKYGLMPAKESYIDRSVSEPRFVQLLGEYDVWDKRQPEADWLQLGIRSAYGTEFDEDFVLDRLVRNAVIEAYHSGHCDMTEAEVDELEGLLHRGEIVEGFSKWQSAAAASRAHDIKWKGLTFLALNHAVGNSQTFAHGIRPHHDALLLWRWDGFEVKVSLYGCENRPNLDLSVIAREMGGGGHKQACGFRVGSLVEWADVLRGNYA